jgi:hypothetical protein
MAAKISNSSRERWLLEMIATVRMWSGPVCGHCSPKRSKATTGLAATAGCGLYREFTLPANNGFPKVRITLLKRARYQSVSPLATIPGFA